MRNPFFPLSIFPPLSSTISISIPGNGKVADPGFILIFSIPVHILIIIPPVSVCHQVSIIGQFCFPIVLKYHIQTSGFICSPTVPSNRKEDKLYELGILSPYLIYALSAVGVVYRIVSPCFSIIFQYLP